jgi:hypothetical protein
MKPTPALEFMPVENTIAPTKAPGNNSFHMKSQPGNPATQQISKIRNADTDNEYKPMRVIADMDFQCCLRRPSHRFVSR